MMKTNKYLALIAVLLFVFVNTYGQSNLSLDKTIEYAESVRVTNGEKSDEYLKALDSVVQVAFLTNNQEARYTYRSQHVEILEAIKGKNNRDYVNALWSLGYACEAIGDTTRAMGHYQECLSLLEKMMEVDESNETADFYIKCVYYVFRNYCASGDFEKADSLVEVLIRTTERVDGKFSCHYLGMLQEGAMVAVRLNHWDDFEKYSTNTINNDKRIDSCNYTYINSAYDNLIRYNFYQTQRVDNSIMLASEYLTRLDSAKGVFSIEKANVLFWLSVCYQDDIFRSIEYGETAALVLKGFYKNQDDLFHDQLYYPIVNNLSHHYSMIGNLNDAIKYDQILVDIMDANGLKNTEYYYDVLKTLFTHACSTGNYPLALSSSKELWPLLLRFSNNKKDILEYNYQLAHVCITANRFDEALSYIDKAIDSQEIKENMTSKALLLTEKIKIYASQNRIKEMKPFIEESKQLLYDDKTTWRSLLVESELFKLESHACMKEGDYYRAIEKIDTALLVNNMLFDTATSRSIGYSREHFFEEGDNPRNDLLYDVQRAYLSNLSKKGSILTLIEDTTAVRYFSEVLDSILKFNEPRRELLRALECYLYACILFDQNIEEKYIDLALSQLKDYYRYDLAFFAKEDRSKSWFELQSIIGNIFNLQNVQLFTKSLYDITLFYKSLLLETEVSFKEHLYNSQKHGILVHYDDLQKLKAYVNNTIFGNISTDSNDLKTILDSISYKENELNHDIKRVFDYQFESNYTYIEVFNKLKTNEIAIEFVDFYHLKDKKTYYVALLAKSGWDKPVYVQLCTEDELKACLGNPNVTYSTGDLYRLLWQPLSEYINEGDKVYFSASGMLHTIALESIHTPDGSCLSDKYNLVRLTSTRELCKEKQPKTYETGAIYGGLQYDVEQQRMSEVAAMNKTELEESPAFALRGEDRGNWNYLQGTKDEAEHIAGIMRQANIRCNLFEGDLGSEESFKALSGGNTDIIHLATHGYFLEGEKADMNDFMKSLSPLARQKTDSVINPLLRSGLILSGGNSAWLGKEVPEGIEDGVLTALEISTMNLSGTDMVVMSACETGLGDITSDGVFGLQRAFKMAGVQTLVMSLWKVDDNATSLMMQTFYEHLLSGMSKREAFNLAQAAVRTKYPEPYYWAGFIMLD